MERDWLRLKYIIPIASFIHITLSGTSIVKAQIVPTIFGNIDIQDPVVEKLLEAPAMKRLEAIDQSGTLHYLGYMPKYTRYSHSVGVYALLKYYNVPQKEQIAGLLHDISHTVFSHVADVLFKDFSSPVAYQDDIHEWFLKEAKIDKILEEGGLHLEDVIIHKNNFPGLEQDLPSMCADRIEYNLHTGLILGLLKKEDIAHLLKNLKFEKGEWYFIHTTSAKKLAYLSLYFTEKIFGAPWNYVLYHWSADLLKRALKLNLINLRQIHFGKDQDILKNIQNSSDPQLRLLLQKCKEPGKYFKVVKEDDFDVHIHPKFRGIDPFVLQKGRLVRLSSIDKEFATEYKRLKKMMATGIKIKFLE